MLLHSHQVPLPSLKCLLVGDFGSGKSTFIHRHQTREFKQTYIATIGVEVHPLHIAGSPYIWNVWDVAGRDNFSGIRENYYQDADCAIVFADSLTDHPHVERWLNEIPRDIPTVVCWNKAEAVANANWDTTKISVVNISTKTGRNVNKPFEILAGMLLVSPTPRVIAAL
jgi:GTP-binding nuclear protein Ran